LEEIENLKRVGIFGREISKSRENWIFLEDRCEKEVEWEGKFWR